MVTSVMNSTPHCSSGSDLKVRALGVDPDLVDAINADPRTARCRNPRLDAIIAYAVKLSLQPGGTTEEDLDGLGPMACPTWTSWTSTIGWPTSATPTGWRTAWA